jgi:dihydroflavonol-4-reductase
MIAITGVSGLVGANLSRTLIEQGREVRGIIHVDRKAVQGLDIELVHGDVRDLDSLKSAFSGVEVVYHLAAQISLEMDNWSEVEEVNVVGVRNLVEACLQCGVQRLIHFSSIHAYQQAPYDDSLDENRPLATSPNNIPYDRSKALGELEIKKGIARGLQAVILNPTAMIGPYDFYPSYFGKALLGLVNGRIPALVKGGFDWVDVRDVVHAAIQAQSETTANAKNYILSGHWRSVRQVAEQAAKYTGRKPPLLTVPTGLAKFFAPLFSSIARFNGSQPIYTQATLDALNSNRQISHARAAAELGFRPRPFVETISDTLDWFAMNGYLQLPDRIRELSGG